MVGDLDLLERRIEEDTSTRLPHHFGAYLATGAVLAGGVALGKFGHGELGAAALVLGAANLARIIYENVRSAHQYVRDDISAYLQSVKQQRNYS